MDVFPPIGYRFRPTDSQLILSFLRPKVHASPLPSNAIPEFDVSLTDPWDLPGHSKEHLYFFTRQDRKFSTTSFTSGCGQWKAMTGYEVIRAPGTSSIVGVKRCFKFYNAHDLETEWMMVQFYLVGSVKLSGVNQTTVVLAGDWIVSCVYRVKDRRRSAVRTLRGTGTSRRVSLRNLFSDSDDELGYSSDEDSMSSTGSTDTSPTDQLSEEASSH